MIWYILYSILISVVFPLATWIYLGCHDKITLFVPDINQEMYFINYMVFIGWFFGFHYTKLGKIGIFGWWAPLIWFGVNLLWILADTWGAEKRSLRVVLLQIGFSMFMLVPLLFVL